MSWFSRTHKCATLFTTEARCTATVNGVKETSYVRGIVVFLMPSLGPISFRVFVDNKGVIDLAENPASSSNSEHIDIQHHFLRELAVSGNVSAEYFRSEDQYADVLTKTGD